MRPPGQSVGWRWSQWLWTCGRARSLSVLVLVADLLAFVHLLRFDEGSSFVVDVVDGPVAFHALLVDVALPLALAHVPVVLAQATLDIFDLLCNDWMGRLVRMVGSIGKTAREHSKIVTKRSLSLSLPPGVSDDENIYLHEMHAPSGHYMQYWREVHDLTVPVLVTARFWIRSRPLDQLVILTVLGIQQEVWCPLSRAFWSQWLQIVVRAAPAGSRSLTCDLDLPEIPGMWLGWQLLPRSQSSGDYVCSHCTRVFQHP